MSRLLRDRLTRSLLEEIASGSWRAGQRFHSVRAIRRLWGVSQPTIVASLESLQEWDLLESSMRRGYFLREEFQQKAQVLLYRNRVPALPPSLHWEQKLRLLQGTRGGKIAVLFEQGSPAPPEPLDKLPPRLSLLARRCVGAFARHAPKHHFTPVYFPYDNNKESAGRIRDNLERGEYAGAAVFCRSGYRTLRFMLEPLFERGLPVVLMYDDCQGMPVHSININNVGMGYDAIRRLYQMGHRRVAAVMQKASLKPHADRIRGSLLAQRGGGCPGLKLQVLRVGMAAPLPPAIQDQFADASNRPTALFFTESALIPKFLPVWQRLGLSIPEDLSLIVCTGRKGVPGAEALDAMQLKVGARIGRIAARQLRRMQNGEPLEKLVLLDAAYIRRGSVRSPTP